MRWSKDNGEAYSSCIWSKDIPSLLPKSDRITFLVNPDSNEMFSVAWDDVQTRIPESLPQEPYLFPNRFRAYLYPTSEQLTMLRALSIDIN